MEAVCDEDESGTRSYESVETSYKMQPEIDSIDSAEPSTSNKAESDTVYKVEPGASDREVSETACYAQPGTSHDRDPGNNRKRRVWDKQKMINAVQAVRQGSMGYLAASKLFGVPKNTLQRYVKKKDVDPSELINTPLGRKPLPSLDNLDDDASVPEEKSASTTVDEKPKNVKRKTWDKQSMIHAVEAVRDGAVGYLAASRMFNVPKITLRRYVQKEKVEPSVLVNAPLGRKPYLPKDIRSSASDKKTWTKENMIKAVLCVRSGKLGYARAGRMFKVPYLTLRWYVKNAKIDLSTEKNIPLESMSELTEMMKTKREPAKRKLWDKQNMINAVHAVRDGAVGYLAASKIFGVPKVTLRRYAKLEDFDPSELIDKTLGRKPAMPRNLQEKLVEYCTEMDERFFGLKGTDVLRMAGQLAAQNNISSSFQKESVGRTWLHNFMKKYPELRIRTTRNAYIKTKKISHEHVSKFVGMYEPIYEKVNRQPHRIFSVDDIGLCVVEDDPERVVRVNGIREYSTFSAEEKNKLVTAIVCMNANGIFVPPLIVWPTKNITKKLMNHIPAGSIWACHSSGWVTAHIFMMWFDHFIKHTSPSAENPVLLLFDCRKPYVRNMEILDKAKENNISIVSLPPNSANLLQPLEVSFANSFKTHYTTEIESYLDTLSDEYKMKNTDLVKPVRIAKMFTAAYNKVEAEQVTEKAFEKVGLCPFMPLIFMSSESSGKHPAIKSEPKTEFQDESSISCETPSSYPSNQSYEQPVIDSVFSGETDSAEMDVSPSTSRR